MGLHGLPTPTRWGTARRAALTAWVTGVMVARLARDRLRGPLTAATVGQRLREGLERLGATAIKMGQQLSVRADLLPQALTRELEKLTDRVPPLPWDQVPALIAAELGRPVAEVFTHIDPNPLGSASLACVYKARLLDGREVAIKVQRPGVARAFAEDLAVFGLATQLLEMLTVVRFGFFRNLRFDMRLMFGEELDFRLEARYQRTFRRIVAEAQLPWVTAPRVVSELCTQRMLVTELVQGVSCRAVIDAVERGDTAAIQSWGLDPERLGRRILLFSGWARLQALMLHVDPHPGNIIVQPDDQLIFIDFGACGPASRRSHRNHREALRLIIAEDHAGVAQVMLNDVSPLPHLDQERLLEGIQASFSRFIRALNSPDAHWSERILAGLWMDMLEVTRQYQIQLNLDTIRAIRAFMLYDTVAYRLAPSMDTAEIRKSLEQIDRRDARQARARLQGLIQGEPHARGELAELLDRARAIVARIEPTLSSVTSLLEAALAIRDAFLRQLTRGIFALGAALVAWGIWRGIGASGWGLSMVALQGALPAVVLLATIVIVARAARSLLFELDRVET